MGLAAVPKAWETIDLDPPKTLPLVRAILAEVSKAALIAGSSNLVSPLIHLS